MAGPDIEGLRPTCAGRLGLSSLVCCSYYAVQDGEVKIFRIRTVTNKPYEGIQRETKHQLIIISCKLLVVTLQWKALNQDLSGNSNAYLLLQVKKWIGRLHNADMQQQPNNCLATESLLYTQLLPCQLGNTPPQGQAGVTLNGVQHVIACTVTLLTSYPCSGIILADWRVGCHFVTARFKIPHFTTP